jgi:hypothetical protein
MPKQVSKRRLIVPLAAVGAIVVCFLITLAIFTLVIRPALFPDEIAGIPLEVTRVSPQISPLAPPPAPVVEVGETSVALAMPTILEVAGNSFSVQPTNPDSGVWLDPSAASGSAVWVYGTVVNYVIGMETTGDNQSLLDGLVVDDVVRLRLSNGTVLTFRVAQREQVRPDDAAVFAQTRPGLTMVLLGDGESERLAVFTTFESVEEVSPQPGGSVVGVGQPVQVGEALVVLEEGHVEPNTEDMPPGTMAYLVDFSVQNTGESPLETLLFVMELRDEVGNLYLPSASVAVRGAYGPLPATIPPGEEINGTAGYWVPGTLSGSSLTWVFAPHLSADPQAHFTIPYAPPAETGALADVDLYDAFLGEGGDLLHVLADVYNDGTAPLVVTEDDISLSSSEGEGELDIAAPPLPWTIEPEGYQEVELFFVPPDAFSVVVTILGFTFEISGLP